MPSFHYISLGQQQKRLAGVIEAPDEASAREKLNELGLAVVSLTTLASTPEIQKSAVQSNKQIFGFEAFDKNNKKVSGTIVAENQLKAYARLFEEYQFNIIYLASASQTPEQKQAARKAGIAGLQAEYEKTYGSKNEKTEEKQKIENLEERKELLDKVTYTTTKIEDFLKKHSSDLKTEERNVIQSYINQLARIKDSTNLDHIRATCEKMLSHIQKQEIFIHEEQKFRESARLKVETKDLLTQLKHTGLQQEIDIVKTAAHWYEKHNFMRPLADTILRIFKAKNPEIRQLRDEIKMTNRHILSYIKLLIFGKTKTLRIEAWDSIKTLREEKKRLKLKIQSIISAEKLAQSANAQETSRISEYLYSALGWILAFYLISYVISYPLTIKQFNLAIPRSFYFYASGATKFITIFLFMAYGMTTIRRLWLKKNSNLISIIYSFAFFAFLLIAINLM